MIGICIVIFLGLLCWLFLISTFTNALSRLGETLSDEIIHQPRFFYYPFHELLFRYHTFDLLIFTGNISQNLARILLGATTLFCVLHLTLFNFTTSLLIFLAAIFLIFYFSDFSSRLLSHKYPRQSLLATMALSSFFLYLSFPVTFLFVKLAELMSRKEKKTSEQPIEEMKETIVKILQEANIQGRLNAADQKLIEAVVHFRERIVREVMVPRIDLFCLPANTTIRQSANLLAIEGYSRVPVYRDSLDNIIGMLMYKDVLEIYMECEKGEKESEYLNYTIDKIAKSVFYTPETKKVSHLLQDFRNKQMHMAIVVDEYGGTAGVVTIEDLLEEIVGEIADEYDVDEETLFAPIAGEKSWIVDARMNIKDADDSFNIEIPQEGDYDTIAGYLFHKLGSIPKKGLKITDTTFELEILSSTDRSVEKVKITPIEPDLEVDKIEE